ncbi:MAG TPA: CehA/McbA family metallohydrolase [Acidobacteriota bacterium]
MVGSVPRRWILGVVAVALASAAAVWWRWRSVDAGGRFGRLGESELQASAADGKGTVHLTPSDPITVSTRGGWTLIYRPAASGIQPGGGVVLQVSPFWGWSEPQTQEPAAPGYSSAVCTDPEVELEADFGPPHWARWTVRGKALLPPAEIRIRYGAAGGGPGAAWSDSFAEHGQKFLLKVDGDGDRFYAEVRPEPALDVLAGPAARLVAVGPSLAVIGEPLRVRVAALDRAENFCVTERGAVRLRSEPEGLAVPRAVELESGAAQIELRPSAAGRFRVVAEAGALGAAVSNPIEVRQRAPRYRLYWGDLHGHSNLSDGTGSVDDYYRYAGEVSGLDIAVLSDHDHHGLHALDERPDLWRSIEAGAARFNRPGAMVTFLAYEWTNWTYGHKHVLYLDDQGPIYSMNRPESDTPEKLWQRLAGHRALTISHHPGGGPVPTDWSFWNPKFEPVVEIVSVHGNSERLGARSGIYSPAPGHFVQDALGRGHRLGLVGSGDSHNGHPGRRDLRALTAGLAGIYARELTRAAIWEAIFARRVFATSGERMVVEFTINGRMMGQELRLAAADQVRRIRFRVAGTAPLRSVVIVKDNRDWMEFKPGGEIYQGEAVDDTPARSGSYYYLRAIQQGDQLAWSSPVWLKIP